jgi:hypothetical protein
MSRSGTRSSEDRLLTHSGGSLRHISAYTGGVFIVTHLGRVVAARCKVRHELRELHQVNEAEERAAAADDDLWIRWRDVRPLRREGVHRPLLDLQEQPHPVSVVPALDARELSPAERMKRVRHADKMLGRDRNSCT